MTACAFTITSPAASVRRATYPLLFKKRLTSSGYSGMAAAATASAITSV